LFTVMFTEAGSIYKGACSTFVVRFFDALIL
jgi:hypothetical protein